MGKGKTKAVIAAEPQGTLTSDDNGGSQSKIQLLEDKVDKLVQTVSALTESMKKTSQAQPLSPVAHSSMHTEKDLSAQKLPSFEELRSYSDSSESSEASTPIRQDLQNIKSNQR